MDHVGAAAAKLNPADGAGPKKIVPQAIKLIVGDEETDEGGGGASDSRGSGLDR